MNWLAAWWKMLAADIPRGFVGSCSLTLLFVLQELIEVSWWYTNRARTHSHTHAHTCVARAPAEAEREEPAIFCAATRGYGSAQHPRAA